MESRKALVERIAEALMDEPWVGSVAVLIVPRDRDDSIYIGSRVSSKQNQSDTVAALNKLIEVVEVTPPGGYVREGVPLRDS